MIVMITMECANNHTVGFALMNPYRVPPHVAAAALKAGLDSVGGHCLECGSAKIHLKPPKVLRFEKFSDFHHAEFPNLKFSDEQEIVMVMRAAENSLKIVPISPTPSAQHN